MPNQEYDLIIIGSGSAAMGAAFTIRNEGWSVAIIDKSPVGGTCALRGCDPKKVLTGAAEIIDRAERMKKRNVITSTKINWPELMAFKNSFTDPVPDSRVESMKQAGIEPISGRAKFTDENTINVNGRQLSAKKILLANGAKPAPLNIDGESNLTYSDEFLSLPELPKNIVFIGGGYITFEFAHIAARAGSSVTILHRGDRVLGKFDKDLADMLVERMRELGIDVKLNSDVKSIEKTGDDLNVLVDSDGERKIYKTNMAVHGAGRIPDIDDMQLEKGNVKYDKRGIIVNDYLQSVSNGSVYSAGDASGSPGLPLTPVAGMESRIAAHNIINGNSIKPDYTATPSVVFTVPPLASVGLGEEEAKEQGIQFKVNFQETSEWYSSKRTGETHSAFKVIIDEKNDTIIGAQLLGEYYEEAINLFSMAIRFRIRTSELKNMIFSYPSRSSDIASML